uniref:Uncharacterized protein n=1 Tax=Macaca fascicularis TaxID=9541 RepID=A0A7N9CYL8_MACFA
MPKPCKKCLSPPTVILSPPQSCGMVRPIKPLILPSLQYVFISSVKRTHIVNWFQEWGVVEKTPKNVEATLDWVTDRGWNSLEGSKNDRKMWASFEPPRDLLNSFDKNADSDMNNKVQPEVVSDGDEKLFGKRNKGDCCYVLPKRLAAFCPCPRDSWNFELERDDLRYLAEEISKQQNIQEVTWVLLKAFCFKRETEHNSSEKLQSGDTVEKKNPFFRKNSSQLQKSA